MGLGRVGQGKLARHHRAERGIIQAGVKCGVNVRQFVRRRVKQRHLAERIIPPRKTFGVRLDQYGAVMAWNFMSLKSCRTSSPNNLPRPKRAVRNWPAAANTILPST